MKRHFSQINSNLHYPPSQFRKFNNTHRITPPIDNEVEIIKGEILVLKQEIYYIKQNLHQNINEIKDMIKEIRLIIGLDYKPFDTPFDTPCSYIS